LCLSHSFLVGFIGCVKDILTNYFNTQLRRIYQILEKLGGNQHHLEHWCWIPPISLKCDKYLILFHFKYFVKGCLRFPFLPTNKKKLQAFLKSSKKSPAISILHRQSPRRQPCRIQQQILRGNGPSKLHQLFYYFTALLQARLFLAILGSQ
jgi:hypothetical protein